MTTEQILFREDQRFRQPWLWAVLVATVAPGPLVFGYGVVRQVIGGHQWGSKPMSDVALSTAAGLTTLFAVGLLAFFWTARLITIVKRDGLFIRFKPIHFSLERIDLSTVESVEAVAYKPLSQFGGWGIRYGIRSKAYNMSGNKGVRLSMGGGRSLLIGSQRPDELAAAIRQVWEAAKEKMK